MESILNGYIVSKPINYFHFMNSYSEINITDSYELLNFMNNSSDFFYFLYGSSRMDKSYFSILFPYLTLKRKIFINKSGNKSVLLNDYNLLLKKIEK